MYGIENESSSLAKQNKMSKYSDYEYFYALFHDNNRSIGSTSQLRLIIATMATLSSNFESIRECRNQVYAIERELIIFKTLIVINDSRLRNFDHYHSIVYQTFTQFARQNAGPL